MYMHKHIEATGLEGILFTLAHETPSWELIDIVHHELSISFNIAYETIDFRISCTQEEPGKASRLPISLTSELIPWILVTQEELEKE